MQQISFSNKVPAFSRMTSSKKKNYYTVQSLHVFVPIVAVNNLLRLSRRILEKKSYSSFPVKHKVDNIGFFVLLKFENKRDTVFSHFKFT